MVHDMNLQNQPFERMKNGKKHVEMRLNDEKRQKIKYGDIIKFSNIETNESIYFTVLSVVPFKNFKQLYKYFNKKRLGYLDDEKASHKDMLKYYTKKDIRKYGVVGLDLGHQTTFEEYHKERARQKIIELKMQAGLTLEDIKNLEEIESTKIKEQVEEEDELGDIELPKVVYDVDDDLTEEQIKELDSIDLDDLDDEIVDEEDIKNDLSEENNKNKEEEDFDDVDWDNVIIDDFSDYNDYKK